jgi:hypothetical protein
MQMTSYFENGNIFMMSNCLPIDGDFSHSSWSTSIGLDLGDSTHNSYWGIDYKLGCKYRYHSGNIPSL